ncbi:MAG: O-antigen ligase family protein [Trueperaceae bacterium]|nr:O-antigen ligase family protein [Trueperaceae bacterium]
MPAALINTMRIRQYFVYISRSWIVVWLLITVLLSISLTISARYSLLWLVWGQAAVAILGHLLFVFKRSWVARSLFVLLLLLSALSIYSWFFNASGFYETDHFWSSLSRLELATQSLQGRGSQTWQVKPEKDMTWTFEAKLDSSPDAWDWLRSSPTITLETLKDRVGVFTHVTVPAEQTSSSVKRFFTLDEPLANRTFKLHVGLRTTSQSGADIQLATSSGHTAAFQLTTEWRLFQTEWTAAAGDSSLLEVRLEKLAGLEFDLRELRLFELVDNNWVDLGTGTSAATRAIARVSEEDVLSFDDFMLSTQWQTYTLAIPESSAPRLNTTLLVDPAMRLDVRNSQVSYLDDTPLPPNLLLRDTRQRLWFSNENFTAHTVTAIGLVFLLATQSLWASIVGYLALLLTILMTGSRTALLVSALGGGLLITLLFRRKQKMQLYYGLLFFVAVFLLTSFIRFGTSSFDMLGLNTRQVVSRFDTWGTAWDAFLEHPLTGLPLKDFSSYFASEHPDLPATFHAHNFWLDWSFRFGVFGLLASLILSAYLVFAFWKLGRWAGIIVILSFLVLQLLDVTLVYSGVLLCLSLTFNLLLSQKKSLQQTSV